MENVEFENILSSIESNNCVIPDSCMTFSEMSDFLSVFIKDEYKSLMESIGIDELKEYENNNSLIYEAGRLSKLIENIKETLQEMFSGIKSFWEKTIKKFSDLSDTNMATKINTDIIDQLESDKVYSTTHEFFSIKELDYYTKAIELAKKSSKMFKKAKESGDYTSIKKEIMATLYIDISGVDCNSITELKSKLKSELLGKSVDCNKEWYLDNFKEIKSIINNDGSVTKIIKKSYDADKKLFNFIASEIDTIDNNYTDIVAPWIETLVEISNVTHACYAVAMDVYRRKFVEYRNAAIKAIKASR